MSAASNKIASTNQLKNTLNSLPEEDLIHVFTIFSTISALPVQKSCKMMSYKCFEATYNCGLKKAKGYGRSEKEAHAHCIRNLLEILLEEDQIAVIFRHALASRFSQENIEEEEDEEEVEGKKDINSNDTKSWNSEQVWKNGNSNCPQILSASIQVNNSFHQSNSGNSNSTTTNYNSTSISPNINGNSNSQNNITKPNNYNCITTQNNNNSNPHQYSQSLNQNTHWQHSDPKEKPMAIQQYLNSSTDYQSSCSKAPLPRKSTQADEVGVTRFSLPSSQLAQYSQSSSVNQQQSKSQLNKSVNSIPPSLSHSQIDKDIDKFVISPQISQSDNDAKWIAMKEEVKRSQNYIEHLERKIKVVLEENKILKSLLVENKKQQRPITSQVVQQDENIPPAQMQSKQPNQGYKQNKDKSISLHSTGQNSFHITEPSHILQDYANKANILNGETLKISPKSTINGELINTKQNNEKMRSLSFDVYAKGGVTIPTDSSNKKLDSSFNECGIVGHRRVKSKIPKLNLEVLPNYHGKSNKSINDQLLVSYQTSQNVKQNGLIGTNNTNYDKVK